MQYANILSARFVDRQNRFLAHVTMDGTVQTVHVKNTGRCRELLCPGAEVFLTAPGTPHRKTAYDLVCVRKAGGLLVNVDSQAPNQVAREWLETQGFDTIVPEYRYGESRLDFFMQRGNERYLMEVKGCTLEKDGVGYFPDAPTERGVKHLTELCRAAETGWCAAMLFVIQMDGITEVRPNEETHPAFGQAWREARKAGVRIQFLPCHVEPDRLCFTSVITV